MSKTFLMGNEAFAHAALEAGVKVCAGYPGTPSSEVLETIAKAHAQGKAEGVHVEWSTNEKAALEMLAGAAYSGARTLFTCKQVGLNVASDALMSLNYVGVEGGTVLFVADDPGPISSQTEQDTRRFASFAKVPVFDPATPEQGCAMIKTAYDVSERYHTPVIVRPTTRVCHASTFIDIEDTTQAKPAKGFEKDSKWVIFPKRSFEAHGEINDRLPKIAADFSACEFNPIEVVSFGQDAEADSTASRDVAAQVSAQEPASDQVPTIGVVAGGISYAYVREALRIIEQLAREAHVALSAVKLMQVGTPYPFPAQRAEEFVQGLEAIMVFEELDHVLEDEFLKLAGQIHAPYTVHGKLTGETTARGENTTDDIAAQLIAFMQLPLSLDGRGMVAQTPIPARPPVLCAGCPHRGSFIAVKNALAAMGKKYEGVYCGDIGCYTLGNAKPLSTVDTCLCMGAGITIAQGITAVDPNRKAVAFVGDSTFFASGMTGVANAVYNGHDITLVVLDNATTAMTGSQPHPGTGVTLVGEHRKPLSIDAVLQALGVEKIIHANPLKAHDAIEAAREAIGFEGPSAVIYESPCTALIAPQAPVEFDEDACTHCTKCVSRLGCPALSWDRENRHPLIDTSLCTGCGLCAELCSDGALACPTQADSTDQSCPSSNAQEA